jgi:hypothetical protein
MAELKDSLKITGKVTIRVFDENMVLIHEETNSNLIVSVGKTYLASWLAAASQVGEFMSYIALGTGNTAPTPGDTGLQSPLPTRVQGVLLASLNTWQNTATFGPGVDTGTISEAGLFSAISSGTMFARNVFSPVSKLAGTTVQVVWQITFN